MAQPRSASRPPPAAEPHPTPTTHAAHSSHTRKRAIDLRLLEYISPVDSNLLCPICHCPYIRPRRLECDHLFCKDCLERAHDTQPDAPYRCPTCRRPVDYRAVLTVPRVMLHMLDDLMARCPNVAHGCSVGVRREEVQDHVDLYCDYAEVECPLETCGLKIRRWERVGGCRHGMKECGFCKNTMMERDLERHADEDCESREGVCDDCGASLLHRNLPVHKRECPSATIACPAASTGCKFVSRRTDLAAHSALCPLLALQPFLSTQKERLDRQEASLKLLQRKTDILEGGFASLQTILGNVDPNYENGLSESSTSLNLPPLNLPILDVPEMGQDTNHISPTAQHLLSLHESLREEVDRVSAAVSELDARSSLLIMNETLRRKEEMAHTNAAVTSVRMQMAHWLTYARIRSQAKDASGISAVAPNTPQSSALSGKSVLPAQPVRRLSDSSRQETKL